MYLLIDTEAHDITTMDKVLSNYSDMTVCGPFKTPSKAKAFLKESGKRNFFFSENNEDNKPEHEFDGVYLLVEVLEAMRPVPTPRVSVDVETIKDYS